MNFFQKTREELEILALMLAPGFTFESFYEKHGRERTITAMELQIEKDKLEILRKKNGKQRDL